jgi:hypothetical protein
VTILSGSIVRVWGVLEQVLQRHEHELSKADRSMRIIRVDMATAAHPERPPLVGVRYKHTLLPEVFPSCRLNAVLVAAANVISLGVQFCATLLLYAPPPAAMLHCCRC